MTDYERGRRDAIRDVIVYLLGNTSDAKDHEKTKKRCEQIEKLTAVAPEGRGVVWP